MYLLEVLTANDKYVTLHKQFHPGWFQWPSNRITDSKNKHIKIKRFTYQILLIVVIKHHSISPRSSMARPVIAVEHPLVSTFVLDTFLLQQQCTLVKARRHEQKNWGLAPWASSNNREWAGNGAYLFNPQSHLQWQISPRPYLQSLPKQQHKLGTNYSNAWDHKVHLVHTSTDGFKVLIWKPLRHRDKRHRGPASAESTPIQSMLNMHSCYLKVC